jgi:hypothetical protein
MDIGQAVSAMRAGECVRRAGWNGKGMWVEYVHAAVLPGGDDLTLPFIVMQTAQGHWIPWLCSQADLLADDWELVS